MAFQTITPGRPGVGGGAPITPVFPPSLPAAPLLQVYVSEPVLVAESFTSLLSLRISPAETVTLTESPTLLITILKPSVADATTLSESVSLVRITPDQPAPADVTVLTDTPTLIITPLQSSVSDTVTVSESTSFLLITPGTIQKIDTVVVTDAPTILITSVEPTVSETATLSEALTFLLTSPIALPVTETITVTETATVLAPQLKPSVTDSTTLTEVITLLRISPRMPQMVEPITLTDTPNLLLGPIIPDIPPPPTELPGSILCLCPGVIEATEVDMFPFAATHIPSCQISAVSVDIVLPHLSGGSCINAFFAPGELPPVIPPPPFPLVAVAQAITVSASPILSIVAGMHPCPCDPVTYTVGGSIVDSFSGGNGPDFPGGWTGITYDPIFASGGILGPNNSWPSIGTIRIKGGLENHRPKNEVGILNDGAVYVNGFRTDLGAWPNWLVRAVWGSDAKTSNSSPNKWYLMAPISLNAGPPYNALMMQAWGFYAQHLSDSEHLEDGYYFGLVNVNVNGVQTNIGSRVHRTALEWGSGHNYALKVVCNELSCVKIQGFVDDILVIEVNAPTIGPKPTGYPGVGLANDYLPNVATVATLYTDNYATLASWTADKLV